METHKAENEHRYTLDGRVLEDDGKAGWIEFICWAGKEEKNAGRIEVFWGRTWIEHDTLIMGPWKVGDNPKDGQPQTSEEVEAFLASLPKWNQTKYFVHVTDIGMSGLMDCQTEEPAPTEIADVIMPKLGFKKAVAGEGGVAA